METEIVNFEIMQERVVEDSFSKELSQMEEHLEARLHPAPKMICCLKGILTFIQCSIIFCCPKNKTA